MKTITRLTQICFLVLLSACGNETQTTSEAIENETQSKEATSYVGITPEKMYKLRDLILPHNNELRSIEDDLMTIMEKINNYMENRNLMKSDCITKRQLMNHMLGQMQLDTATCRMLYDKINSNEPLECLMIEPITKDSAVSYLK